MQTEVAHSEPAETFTYNTFFPTIQFVTVSSLYVLVYQFHKFLFLREYPKETHQKYFYRKYSTKKMRDKDEITYKSLQH